MESSSTCFTTQQFLPCMVSLQGHYNWQFNPDEPDTPKLYMIFSVSPSPSVAISRLCMWDAGLTNLTPFVILTHIVRIPSSHLRSTCMTLSFQSWLICILHHHHWPYLDLTTARQKLPSGTIMYVSIFQTTQKWFKAVFLNSRRCPRS